MEFNSAFKGLMGYVTQLIECICKYNNTKYLTLLREISANILLKKTSMEIAHSVR
jgi:hypothetical protein